MGSSSISIGDLPGTSATHVFHPLFNIISTMQEVVRAWARVVDRHLFPIFLLKLLLGSLLFIGILRILGDFGRECRMLAEVEILLEECSLRRLELERQSEREKAENGSGIVNKLNLCERKMERQGMKLEEAKVKMEDTRRAFGARIAQQVAREAQVHNFFKR